MGLQGLPFPEKVTHGAALEGRAGHVLGIGPASWKAGPGPLPLQPPRPSVPACFLGVFFFCRVPVCTSPWRDAGASLGPGLPDLITSNEPIRGQARQLGVPGLPVTAPQSQAGMQPRPRRHRLVMRGRNPGINEDGKLVTGCWATLHLGRRSAGLEPQIQGWGCQEEESGLQDHATDTDGTFLACRAPGKEVAVGRVEARAGVLRMETAACCVTWAWLPNLSGLQCSDSGLGQQESHVYGGRPRSPASMPLPMPMVSALGSPGVGG